MRILILGATGFAGKRIRNELKGTYDSVYGTYHTQNETLEYDNSMFHYELGDDETLSYILETVKPVIVISCLRGDFNLLLHAHQMVADYLKTKDTKRFIFLSSANVYDGILNQPHIETEEPIAESDYGKYKIACEKLLVDSLGKDVAIIRIPEIWGKDSPRLNQFIESVKQQKTIATYENIYVNYTTNIQIANMVLYILENDLRGVFHVGTNDYCEYIQFQTTLAQRLGLPKPQFTVTKADTALYQAVIPGRAEIPEYLHTTIDNIIDQLVISVNDK